MNKTHECEEESGRRESEFKKSLRDLFDHILASDEITVNEENVGRVERRNAIGELIGFGHTGERKVTIRWRDGSRIVK